MSGVGRDFFLYLLEILRGSLKFETVQGNITTTTAILRLSTINIVFGCYRGCRQARRTKIGKGGGEIRNDQGFIIFVWYYHSKTQIP